MTEDGGRARWAERAVVLGLLGGLHAVLFLLLEDAGRRAAPSVPSPDALIAAFIRPQVPATTISVPVVDPRSLRLRRGRQLFALPVAQVDSEPPAAGDGSAAVVPPVLHGDGHSGMQLYLQQAGLQPGEGATVLLRIEVLESGAAGRIEIDASSGRQQVDQAAVGYARIQHWDAARINRVPRTVWIRWGVRFQA
jgi:TonB family protein